MCRSLGWRLVAEPKQFLLLALTVGVVNISLHDSTIAWCWRFNDYFIYYVYRSHIQYFLMLHACNFSCYNVLVNTFNGIFYGKLRMYIHSVAINE